MADPKKPAPAAAPKADGQAQAPQSEDAFALFQGMGFPAHIGIGQANPLEFQWEDFLEDAGQAAQISAQRDADLAAEAAQEQQGVVPPVTPQG